MIGSNALSLVTAAMMVLAARNVEAFVVIVPSNNGNTKLLSTPRDDASILGEDGTFFHMQQIPTATAGARLDRVVDCAENGQCDIEEMMAMIDGAS